jgi:signal transduction histidine kinase
MYRRLIILSAIILLAMCGMSWLGHRSITIWEDGLKGARIGQFANAAEQIRRDVKRKLDEFMKQERDRPYTDYQYYYIPENVAPNRQPTTLISPLNGKLSNGMAYGYFQVEVGGRIVTPYFDPAATDIPEDSKVIREAKEYVAQVRKSLLPSISVSSHTLALPRSVPAQTAQEPTQTSELPAAVAYDQKANVTAGNASPKQELKVESLVQSSTQQPQVVVQNRAVVSDNTYLNQPGQTNAAEQIQKPQKDKQELVNIRIEPFVSVMVNDEKAAGPIFSGQIYMLRHVNIEDRDIVQGFRFDEKRLMEEVRNSAKILPPDMSFETSPPAAGEGAYAAALSFGRGELPFWIKDKDPGMIARQTASLRNWYFGIVLVVFAAVMLGLAGVWRNAWAMASLSQKKDDFISAVSHELRTPLTSIRMHSEMLENKWVKSQEKADEYYRSMRQESERLSRLIENVLDFSRIQRGRKKYNFATGDINQCIAGVIEMMKPYAAQSGFAIEADMAALPPTKFDKDAVTQIVVNLLDNAIKYARETDEKTIYVRTHSDGQYTIIEVEDRGPGLPHKERKKVFEQFYRVAAESTREVPGTGLGLAIVKKFVEAHDGFVEILPAKPKGAIFRVGLPAAGK